MSNQSIRLACLILIVSMILTVCLYKIFEHYQPSALEVQIADLEKCAQLMDVDYPFVTGIISELADHDGGTLPLRANEKFEAMDLVEKYNKMEYLTSFSLDAESKGRILNLGRFRKYRRVVIETSSGLYRYSKDDGSFTVTS